ncbi:MAG: ArnT family glycosyltransferase, partial [Gemmataceae bacterium]
MDTLVGARIQVQHRAPSVVGTDRLGIVALLLIAGLVHAIVITRTTVSSRDSLGFARFAHLLETPTPAANPDGTPRTIVDTIRTAEHPPGYALTVLATSAIVRQVTPLPRPEMLARSAQIATALAGCLLIVPMYFLGRLLFGRVAGFLGTLLFQVLPIPLHTTSDGLAEGLYLLLIASSLVALVRGVRHRSTFHFLLAGVAAGGSFLVRPE